MITLKEYYTIRKLKADMDAHVGFDISTKGRSQSHVNAKRAFIYVCRLRGFIFQNIGEAIGYNHDVAVYHNRKAKEMIELKDRQFINLVNEVYDMDLLGDKDPKMIRIKELEAQLEETKRLEPFIDLLKQVPSGKVWEVRDRLELFLKGFNYSHKDTVKEYTAKGTEMSGIF